MTDSTGTPAVDMKETKNSAGDAPNNMDDDDEVPTSQTGDGGENDLRSSVSTSTRTESTKDIATVGLPLRKE